MSVLFFLRECVLQFEQEHANFIWFFTQTKFFFIIKQKTTKQGHLLKKTIKQA